jgi:membrane protease YdiL (CAAX protease family)
MNQEPTPSKRSLLARVFLSPDEPRLRAGWRLLLHFLLLILITIALLSISLLITSFSNLDLVVLLVAVSLATWIARRFFDRRSFRSLGFKITRHALLDMAFGFALPAMMMGLIYLCEWSMGWLHFEGWAWATVPPGTVLTELLVALAIFIAVGYYEELFSRGYQLQNLAEGLNLHWAIFLSSAFFSLLHWGNPHASLISGLGILLAGYFLAYAWVRTRQLWLAIGLHIGWNFFEGPIFGFPVSGLDTFRLIRQSTQGPALFTGGAFGPEAGLILLPALLLGAFLIKLYTRNRIKTSVTEA